MTANEQKSINEVYTLLALIRSQNDDFRQDVKSQVDAINEKVDKKHIPLYFEQNILSIVQSSISKSIEDCLKGYSSPLSRIVVGVIESRNQQLKEIITSSFDQVIQTEDFKQSIITAFSHKIAKNIISGNDGLVDKVCNKLKTDPVFKSKITIAISNVVEQCLNTSTKSDDGTVTVGDETRRENGNAIIKEI